MASILSTGGKWLEEAFLLIMCMTMQSMHPYSNAQSKRVHRYAR